MNENAKKWVEALRSGEYEQCSKQLRKKHRGAYRYCCLGVAADISSLGNWNNNEFISGLQREDQVLVENVKIWLGLNTSHGRLDIKKTTGGIQHITLAELNDEGKSFSEIADIIEKYQDQLFVPDGHDDPRDLARRALETE